jgi:hypothetical protein
MGVDVAANLAQFVEMVEHLGDDRHGGSRGALGVGGTVAKELP